ncbi:extracellular solute-binding protein family 1 [Beutenbergia cavernae DSM 12333]|uniref:Extracellular solute-binding protein family 1 n=1 Tax=Beutenbergia cavernae (strain ATCC BAA-8 / DSM 12333 / CCUG 43141 / JCM 11478 / NBRC 16432 / NCIMB 13614 / HKI 0122) TaxID=471853 RepID=C5BYG4_BEUC1|nr:sugar ABC transporter substrate-binding protein [Beutenbergia cavernae]ACQ81064.1 extracellular solute-binding protein family 1 [Beutenbergia cavernae DSM 12333]
MTRTGTHARTRVRAVVAATAALTAAGAVLAGCAPPNDVGRDGRTIVRYWMWDSSQMPGYQQCADDFEAANDDIEIRIEQYGWDDYWTQLTASFVAENAPDVFVDHTAHFGKFVVLDQILDISDRVEADGVDLDQYQDGLTSLWTGPDGESLYGLPKDWDTEALFYNTAMIEEAGYSAEDLWELEWNPTDGGSFEELVAALTVDANGVRGNQEGFDADNVATYGLGFNGSGGAFGQTQWSPFALGNDWQYADQNPWGTEFYYGDDEFTETISWWRSLIEKGYMPPLAQATSGVNQMETLGAGGYAMIVEGAWNARAVSELAGIEAQVAPTPIGPSGQRASVFNGLSDAIWSGTPNPDEAWRWVSYLGSPDCQDVMADSGRIFPAIRTSTDTAIEVFEGLGIDAEAFAVHVDDGTTVPTQISDRFAQIDTIMLPALDSVMAFDAEPDTLVGANDRVNALFDDD